jgi:glycine oxidase
VGTEKDQMNHQTDNLIVGLGLAGTTLAWRLHQAGQRVVLVDRNKGATASTVAAGLVTPWTGRRMTRSDNYQEDWDDAISFYRHIEEQLGLSLFTEQSTVRVFVNRSDEAVYEQRRAKAVAGQLEKWSGQLQTDSREIVGCRMQPAGRLDVRKYLQASIDFFSERGQWHQMDLELPGGLKLEADQVVVPELDLAASRVIFCQGAVKNPWFEGIPNNASRGDVINVMIDNYQTKEVVHQSIWLAPEQDGSVTAGSTYDWEILENTPIASGRREILNAMRRFIEGPIRVKQHIAAVRPTMKDYRPVVGQHPKHSNLWILNGLGSRGVLTAPRLARLMAETITGALDHLPPDISPERLRGKEERRSLTQLAQDRIAESISPGDIVIDATVGNGFDTSFLAEQVGTTGQVYGFDLQEQAIQSTHNRLDEAGLANVSLIQKSHVEIHTHVTQPVTAAMFNLGYLPRSDHSIVTNADSTIAALEQVIDRLVAGGMITILAYRGHEGGPEEAEAVESWLQDRDDCTVERLDSRPAKPTSPVLFVMTKEDRKHS